MLISKAQHWKSQAEKLEDERLQGWQEKPEVRKNKTCFDKPTVMAEKNANLDVSYRRY